MIEVLHRSAATSSVANNCIRFINRKFVL